MMQPVEECGHFSNFASSAFTVGVHLLNHAMASASAFIMNSAMSRNWSPFWSMSVTMPSQNLLVSPSLQTRLRKPASSYVTLASPLASASLNKSRISSS